MRYLRDRGTSGHATIYTRFEGSFICGGLGSVPVVGHTKVIENATS